MRKAASGWEDDCARRLVEDGFRRGRAASTIFYHPKTQVRVVVHSDDFTFAGTVVHGDDLIIEEVECEMRLVEATPRKKYIVKLLAMLGQEQTKDKVLNNLIRTVEFPRHVEKCWWDAKNRGAPNKLWIGGTTMNNLMQNQSKGTNPLSRAENFWHKIVQTSNTV